MNNVIADMLYVHSTLDHAMRHPVSHPNISDESWCTSGNCITDDKRFSNYTAQRRMKIASESKAIRTFRYYYLHARRTHLETPYL